MPLRFINMYAGERLVWIVHTIDRFLDELNHMMIPGAYEKVILLYDVACQLYPHLRNNRPDLLERLNVAVNKFHGYAHEYRCQELFGQHQTENIGQSDGEGTERVWSLLRAIVASG